ncbi:MAG TPA: CPBP family intramembrane glutamic endopeptidase [Bryobacteraceae bacterium]|nr:CPBP family intramembrane glutamic endopeptidase [Bryobacteraceae bacterium]
MGDDTLAASLRGFGPIGILSILVILLAGNFSVGNAAIVPAGALLALAWARLSRTPWQALGYVRPKSWIATLAFGFAFGISFKIAMKMLVMPLLGADPVNHTYHFLSGNAAMLPGAVWTMLVAGFGEETVYRGFLFERAAKLFGPSAAARGVTVLLTAGLFAAAHYVDQGLTGVEQALMTGLVFGSIFATTGHIFFLMAAHAAFDLTAVAIIYWDLESKVSHFVFR